ncbi:ATP-NAD kinase-like domain-containing protein, partial [Jimgerdemannia flammicorona]
LFFHTAFDTIRRWPSSPTSREGSHSSSTPSPGAAVAFTSGNKYILAPLVAETFPNAWKFARTEYSGHAVELTRELLNEGYMTVVAMGGDGTINQVVNGYMRAPESVRQAAAIGVISVGTGGDFVRTIGIARDPVAALNIIARQNIKVVDVGNILHEPLPAAGGHKLRREKVIAKTTTYFINICSFGCSGHIVKSVASSPLTKRLASSLVYWTHSISANLYAYVPKSVRFSTSSDATSTSTSTITEPSLCLMAICNGQYFGGGMRVGGADADPSDGFLDVLVMRDIGLWHAATKVAGGIKSGGVVEAVGNQKAERRRVERIVAEGVGREGEGCCVEADGEFIGELSVIVWVGWRLCCFPPRGVEDDD